MASTRSASNWTAPGRERAAVDSPIPDGRGEARTLAAVHRDRLEIFSHPTLKDTAAAHVRNEILSGRLRPGEKIDQEKIAAALGISRLPVREALIELTQENLVDTIPRRGCFVSLISKDDISDIYDVQGHIAGIAARRAATTLSEDQLVALRDIYRRFLKAKGTDGQADLSFAFFQLVLDAGGSTRLRSLLRRLYKSLPVDYFDHLPSLFDRTARYHKQLLTALEHRDGNAAAEIMAKFHHDTGRLVVENLGKEGLWEDSPA